MKFSWITDIHLNFMDEHRIRAFADTLKTADSDFVLLTGDISESHLLETHLRLLDAIVSKPIYFVLGNHDFWRSSVARIHERLPKLMNELTFARWMTTSGVVSLGDRTCVIGHEGWYDCQYGDWQGSEFIMADWRAMEDYKGSKTKEDIVVRSRNIAQIALNHFGKVIPQAVMNHDRIIVLTHFPPFEETYVYQGQVGNPHTQPYFTNKSLGDMLLKASEAYPNKQFIVFAGHTHGRVSKQVRHNLVVHVGGAEYNMPEIQKINTL